MAEKNKKGREGSSEKLSEAFIEKRKTLEGYGREDREEEIQEKKNKQTSRALVKGERRTTLGGEWPMGKGRGETGFKNSSGGDVMETNY